jgi:hypothetical protein
MPTSKHVGHPVYLVTLWGKPHSTKGFGNWFKDQCCEAGLEGLSAHGLRKLAAQRCAEAGASEHQLMALFGWTNPQQAGVYTKKANRAKLEAQAAASLETQSSNKSVPPFPAVASRRTVGPKAPYHVCLRWRPLPDSNRCCRRERGINRPLADIGGRHLYHFHKLFHSLMSLRIRR